MSYSDKQLTTLAQNNPKELAQLLSSPNADIRMLASGAEILGGESSDEEVVLPVFKRLLKHVNAIVREGAVLGVSSFYIDKIPPLDILNRLNEMADNDPSPTIKDTAKLLLKDYK
jgi:hypothetical protein